MLKEVNKLAGHSVGITVLHLFHSILYNTVLEPAKIQY